MITAKHQYKNITRDASHFKWVNPYNNNILLGQSTSKRHKNKLNKSSPDTIFCSNRNIKKPKKFCD